MGEKFIKNFSVCLNLNLFFSHWINIVSVLSTVWLHFCVFVIIFLYYVHLSFLTFCWRILVAILSIIILHSVRWFTFFFFGCSTTKQNQLPFFPIYLFLPLLLLHSFIFDPYLTFLLWFFLSINSSSSKLLCNSLYYLY